jgi:hypothetical protein
MKGKVDRVLKAIIERRMNNWGDALARGQSIRSAMKGIGAVRGFNLARSSAVFTGSSVPVLYGEAEETDLVLRKLREPQRRALELQYVHRPPVSQRHREMRLTNGAYYRLVGSAEREFLNCLKTFQNIPPGDS